MLYIPPKKNTIYKKHNVKETTDSLELTGRLLASFEIQALSLKKCTGLSYLCITTNKVEIEKS